MNDFRFIEVLLGGLVMVIMGNYDLDIAFFFIGALLTFICIGIIERWGEEASG